MFQLKIKSSKKIYFRILVFSSFSRDSITVQVFTTQLKVLIHMSEREFISRMWNHLRFSA